jgi:hypothetical protein
MYALEIICSGAQSSGAQSSGAQSSGAQSSGAQSSGAQKHAIWLETLRYAWLRTSPGVYERSLR